MSHDDGRGFGTSEPPLSCQELDDKEHWVLYEVCRIGKQLIDSRRIAARIGITIGTVNASLEGLVDTGHTRRRSGEEFTWYAGECLCVKPPGQNPFLRRELTDEERVGSRGGLGGTERACTSRVSVARKGDRLQDLGTQNTVFDNTTIKGPRNVKGILPMQAAFGLIRYFDKLAEATTSSRWSRMPTTEKTWFQKELYRWLTRDGLVQSDITYMIQEFFADLEAGTQRTRDRELWRVFVTSKNIYYRRLRSMKSNTEETPPSDPGTEKISRPSILPTRRDVQDRRRR